MKTWEEILEEEFEKEYYRKLKKFVLDEYASKIIYPSKENIFNAFNLCPLENLKVVIIGQDPYHTPGYAHGLCFSVNRGVQIPMSLQNIYKELQSDIGIQIPNHGCLESWAEQGVLLLNSVLTVEQGKAGSHTGKGWEIFTNIIVKTISDLKEGIVFLLWGKYAQEKGLLIDSNKHHILRAAHPSPFSAHNGFFGCKHFSKTNELLAKMNKTQINWSIMNIN